MFKSLKFFEMISLTWEENVRVGILPKLANTKRPGLNKIVIQETSVNLSIEVEVIQMMELDNS